MRTILILLVAICGCSPSSNETVSHETNPIRATFVSNVFLRVSNTEMPGCVSTGQGATYPTNIIYPTNSACEVEKRAIAELQFKSGVHIGINAVLEAAEQSLLGNKPRGISVITKAEQKFKPDAKEFYDK